MALSFKRAPAIAKGQDVCSSDYNGLALAINDRLRSGVADPTYRIHQHLFSPFRQVRNPDESGLSFPALAEFLEYYLHVPPEAGEWPVAGAGDPEGANLACPAMAFAAGSPSAYSEAERLQGVSLWLPENPTPGDRWELGKLQRGAYASSDLRNMPALEAAQSFATIAQPLWSFHGKTYGGYAPAPEILGDCGDEYLRPNHRIFFTKLSDGSVKSYAGTCPADTPNGAGNHVAAVWRGPFAYVVYLFDGTREVLPRREWIEGPYIFGGEMHRQEGEPVSSVLLTGYLRDFGGIDADRIGGRFEIDKISFDFDRFERAQYLLAPAYGTPAGGGVAAVYPSHTFTGSTTIPAGTSSPEKVAHAGFVLAAVYVRGDKLTGTAVVEALEGSEVVDTFTLIPGEDGTAEAVFTYPEDTKARLTFRLAGDAHFEDSTGSIFVEVAELLAYKPERFDSYLILRLATTRGDFLSALDTIGTEVANGPEILEGFLGSGCIVNPNGVGGPVANSAEVNSNPVLDGARRMVREWIRVIPRRLLLGYEVDSQGRSVLYFRRWMSGPAGPLDPWEGITQADGTEGIRRTASEDGTEDSNEWLMFGQFKAYDATAIGWRPDQVADYFPFSNRAHFYSAEIHPAYNSDLLRQFSQTPPWVEGDSYGAQWLEHLDIPSVYSQLIAPESPSAYNYAGSTNRMQNWTEENKRAFYKSNPVYPPDDELESATITNEGGLEVVRLIFRGRFQHCPEAPSTIPRDLGPWDRDALRAETYRTTENAIREYLIDQLDGTPASRKIGDTAALSFVYSLFPINGSVYPHFFFTKLLPLVREDGNCTVEDEDSLVLADRIIQATHYTRAICEGYVAGGVTTAYGCAALELHPDQVDRAFLFDYTWETLNFEAHGGRWLSSPSSEFRPDKPDSWGPLPSEYIYAETLDHLAAMVNLLTKARVILPYKLEGKFSLQQGFDSVSTDWPSSPPCSTGSDTRAIKFGYQPPSAGGAPVDPNPEWAEVNGVSGSTAGAFIGCDGDAYRVETDRHTAQYRYQISQPESLDALSPDLRALLELNGAGFVAKRIRTEWRYSARAVASESESETCQMPTGDPFYFYWVAGEGYKLDLVNPGGSTSVTCGLFTSGSIDCGAAPPSGDYAYGIRSTGDGIAQCHFGSGVSIQLYAIGDNSTGFVEVPLRD